MRRRILSGWEIEHLLEHLDQFFDVLSEQKEPASRAWTPSIDMAETAESVQVRVDVPGIDRSLLEISLQSGRLRIKGHKPPHRFAGGTTRCHRIERAYGEFLVEIPLPCPVQPHAAHAGLANGVLTIDLPRVNERRALVYQIPIIAEEP